MSSKLNQAGVIRMVPLLAVIAVIGTISFLMISAIGPFSKGLFFNLFPKPTSRAAVDLYVSPTGLDSNPCSQTLTCKTIQRAADIVTPGQTVHILPGTYTNAGSNPVVTTNISGTANARIVFLSDTKWGTKLVSNNAYRVWMNNANFVDIVGFDISAIDTTVAHLGIQNQGSNVSIRNNNVHNLAHDVDQNGCDSNGGAGIDNSNYSASDNDIIGNVVHDIGNPQNPIVPSSCWGIHGIYHSNLRGHIYNNITYGNEAFGIHLWHAANAVTAANNLSFHNGVGGIQVGAGDAPGGIVFDNSVISNNIIRDNPQFGIRGAAAAQMGLNNKYLNNNILNSGSQFTNITSGISGTLAIDSQFVNYQIGGFVSGGDYHLKTTSPMIDVGSSQGVPSSDYEGNSRPQGSGFDIGPFEFLAAIPTPSPTPVPTPTVVPSPTPSKTPTPTPTPTKTPIPTQGKVGDLDGDGDVDIFDYSTLVSNFGRTGTNILGDLDHDGDVDIFDYSTLVSNFGK